MKKPFTLEQVQELLPGFDVREEFKGIRIKFEKDLSDYPKNQIMNPMVAIIKAALALKLAPEQIEDESEYTDDRRMGSSWTGVYGSEWIRYDTLFLYRVPK